MYKRQYRFKFYLNARHWVLINNIESIVHPHTWEIVLLIDKKTEGFIEFSQIENVIHEFLSVYEGRLLNELPPFNEITPVMENIGEFFHEKLTLRLNSKGWELIHFEISENPARTFVISRESLNDSSESEALPAADEMRLEPLNQEPIEGFESAMEKEDTEHVKKSEAISKIGNLKGENKKLPGVFFTVIKNPLPVSVICIILSLTLLLVWINRSGYYPWGSDSWYHLFKGNLIYNSIISGDLYPLYTGLWYNGIQPLRYWAPLPHYILAVFELFTGGNVPLSYNIFIAFVFVTGAFGWVLWGIKARNKWLGLVAALIWFFLPDNLRVLFSEGNLSRVLITSIFPYILLVIWLYMEKRDKKLLVYLAVLMSAITLSHAMITAMVGITVFLFVLIYGLINKRVKPALFVAASTFSGILLSGIWLYPALKGGLLSMDRNAVSELMKDMTYPLMESVNPLLRLDFADVFYFGASILLVTVLGLWAGDRNSRAGFVMVLLIFLGTAREFSGVLAKFPESQLFWMMRFTPLAMGLFFMSLLLWKKIRVGTLSVFIAVIVIDCAMSFSVLGHNAPMPGEVRGLLDRAVDTSSGKIAVLDKSEFGSFPSFYISYNGHGKKVEQVFGSGWQGAHTANNIMWLNTAIEKGYYRFLTDRCLELGADTLLVKKDVIKNMNVFLDDALKAGYEKKHETALGVILKHPVDYTFGTKVRYEGLGIGKYAGNMSFVFPKFETGRSLYVDDYTESELLKYKTVFLSGFMFRDKSRSEEIVRRVSDKGVKFIIDLTGVESDIFLARPSFLGVTAQPVEFEERYPEMHFNYGDTGIEPDSMPQGYPVWNTSYLENLERIYGYSYLNNQTLGFWGTKVNDNIVFIGFNIPFFAFETKDPGAVRILEQAAGIEAYSTPQRNVVKVNVKVGKNTINIHSEDEGVLTGIAGLDNFSTAAGKLSEVHNLISAEDRYVSVRYGYPFPVEGAVVSLIGLVGVILVYVCVDRRLWFSNVEAGESV